MTDRASAWRYPPPRPEGYTQRKAGGAVCLDFQHYAKPGDRILDTHLGSGSSRIAAWDAGLDFTGYEIDPEYFEAQEKRFQQHTAQMSLFGGGYLITIYIFRKMKATCAWC